MRPMTWSPRWRAPQALAERRCRSTRTSRASTARRRPNPQPGATVEAARPARHRQHADRGDRVGEGRRRQAAAGLQPRRICRSIACASIPADSALTTNQGVPVADNQNSLKAGLRGPALLEDFILREKITHFDHERIPERIVHARGSAAHGYFECYQPLTDVTRASLFAEAGKRTPVFVRFSTVLGERGSADTPRDVRGFAVKFYTDEGNWDLVGNNIPVFFIQDAMKFPDLIHAAKPEPHFAMPQAATAHDTFWDFVSLMPESTHMLMWAMSDRALPRSYRMMQGFGVHTFRLVNDAGRVDVREVPLEPGGRARTRSTGTRRVKISGADPDFHRRDLWEAIEAGAFPEWELGFQIFTEKQAEAFSFDVLDADQARARGAGAGACRSASMVLEPQPRQLLRRDRAGRLLRGARRPGHRLHATIRCWRGASIRTRTRRSRAWADRTSTRSRSTRRSRRRTTTSATACTARPSTAAASPTSRTRSAAAARSRRAPAGFTSFREPHRRRQGAGQAGDVRRPLHPGDAVLEQPDARSRRRTSSAASASS